MTEESQASGSDEAPLDLSDLNFGPSWAREKSGGSEKKEYKEYKERPQKGRHGDQRGGGGGQRREGGGGQRREGGGGGQRREGGGGGQRREGGGGGNFNKGGHGKGRGNFDPRERRQREEIPAPADVTGQILPGEEGLDTLAKEILGSGRTYSVFDLAKVVMSARERFNVGFKSTDATKFFRCKKDGAVWLSKAEAIGHFTRAPWRRDYYREVVTDAEAPKGNFQAVAICGISNEILGPPNYHGYQTELMKLHRERFANMPIDRYKSKVRMERSEEAVNAWLEKMSKQARYLPLSGEAPAEEPKSEVPAEAPSAEKPDEETVSAEPAEKEEEVVATEAVEVAEVAEVAQSEAAATEEASQEENAEEPAAEAAEVEEAKERSAEPDYDPADLLDDLQAVERHFSEHHFKEVFVESNRVWVPGGVPGNQLSPGLLTLLRETVSEERRYPGKLTPMLCRQLSGRHVAVFKWQKKLKVGPCRPHEVPTDIQLAERPQALLNWSRENSGSTLEQLWGALLEKDVTDQVRHEWYHDLHWLLNQGYVLLLANSTIHLAKKPGAPGGATPPKKKAPKAEAKKSAPVEEPKTEPAPAEAGEKPAESQDTPEAPPEPAPPIAEAKAEAPPAATEPAENQADTGEKGGE